MQRNGAYAVTSEDDARHLLQATYEMLPVGFIWPVVNNRIAVAIKRNLPFAGVAGQYDVGRHVAELRHQLFVALRVGPGREQAHQSWMRGHHLETHAIIPLEVGEVRRIDRLKRPLPRLYRLCVEARHAGDWMQAQMPPNVGVGQPRTQQQRWRFHRATGNYHHRRAHDHFTSRARHIVWRPALHANRTPGLSEHALHLAAHDETRPTLTGILQERQHGGLFAPKLAAIATGSTALLTAGGVARNGLPFVAQRLAATLQRRIVGVGRAIVGIDAQALLSEGETPGVVVRSDATESVLAFPLL